MGSQKNKDILDKLQIKQLIDYIQNYQWKWKSM
jgi:hypothetical protein